MRPEDRAMARKQLDKRLSTLRQAKSLAVPPRGWIKAIRESLGMTTAQLGARMGVSQPRIIEIEKNETGDSITLDTLRRAANALECELVYALVPKHSLETVVEQRALNEAKNRLATTSHSMALENQSVDKDDEQDQVKALAKKLADKSGSELWSKK